MLNQRLKDNIQELITLLEKENPSKLKAVIGFDGFVDEIIHVVNTRHSPEEYTRIKTIAEFGKRISRAAGLSTNMEMVPVQVKLGGNGPIMCNALLEYGVKVSYIGALGRPQIKPVFRKMAESCSEVFSIADPGHTDAMEFEDGKLMFGKHEPIKDINWANIQKIVGIEKLVSIIEETDFLALVNWTMLPYMNEIWQGFIEEVFPKLKALAKEKIVFFDLADPEKRTKEDILEALQLIEKFSAYFKVILGLNKKEAQEIAEVLELEGQLKEDLEILTSSIAQRLDIDALVVHPVTEAAAYVDKQYFYTEGPYTAEPLITTGAGDNFNAGFCLGQTLGLPVQLSLVLATATSGFYVRHAKSPTQEEVIHFLKEWLEELEK